MNKNKAHRKIIIKNKVKNPNSDYLKTESQKDLNKIKNLNQNSLYNLDSYKPYDNEEIRGTMKPNVKKPFIVDNKEKKNGSKKNIKKEKEKQNAKTKKLVNFVNNQLLMKQQKSERKLIKDNNEEDDDIELKLNKSVALFKNDIYDNNNLEETSYVESNKNLIDEKKIQENNINKIKNNENNNEKRQPNLKTYKKEEEINKEESKEKVSNPQEEQNKIEVIELKCDNLQINKVELNDEDIKDFIKADNNIDNENAKLKKVCFNNDNDNITPEKPKNREISNNKEQNKKVNTIKKSSKNKKGNKSNLLKTEEPKSTKQATKTKVSNAIKKVNMANKTVKYQNLSNDLRQTVGIPFLQNLRHEIMSKQNNNQKGLNEQNKSHKNLLEEINIDDNIKTITIFNHNDENYTGLALLKYKEGEKVKEIKLEGTIDNINDLLNKEKIEINNKEIVLIDKNELEKLKKENEAFQNQFFKLKEEYDKQRELLKNTNYNINDNVDKNKNDNVNNINNNNVNNNDNINNVNNNINNVTNNNNVNNNNNNVNNNNNIIIINNSNENEKDPFLLFRKKTMEEENTKMEEENIKIKEIKERIQKYKEELKKGSNLEPINERMSCRINNKKDSTNIEQKMKEFEKKREKMKKEEKKKQIESYEKKEEKKTQRQIDNYENKLNNLTTTNNNNNNKNIEEINYSAVISKDKGDKKENKEKDKAKGYSKAMDRFKKRFKNHSMEIRTKKSERINEIAKNLESVIGRQQNPEPDNKNNANEVVNYQNSTEIIENQPTVNKTKKPKKPQL